VVRRDLFLRTTAASSSLRCSVFFPPTFLSCPFAVLFGSCTSDPPSLFLSDLVGLLFWFVFVAFSSVRSDVARSSFGCCFVGFVCCGSLFCRRNSTTLQSPVAAADCPGLRRSLSRRDHLGRFVVNVGVLCYRGLLRRVAWVWCLSSML